MVSKKQIIPVWVKVITKERLKQAFRKLNLDGVELGLITRKREIAKYLCNEGMRIDTLTLR